MRTETAIRPLVGRDFLTRLFRRALLRSRAVTISPRYIEYRIDD